MLVNMFEILWTVITVVSLYFANSLQTSVDNSNNIPQSKSFRVYWNSPTFQCKSHKIYFDQLLDKYRIIHNNNGDFRGEAITILYDPGMFPALLTNGSDYYYRNGGLPQNGNITLHYQYFKEAINDLIPDENFAGAGIIDFESWRPIFRQNFGTLTPYKEISVEEEREKHPQWPESLVVKEATRRFELAGQKFMEQTLLWARQLRSKASWGYYAYPYCYNMSPNNMNAQCSAEVKKENDRSSWLYNASQNLYPSLYVSENRLSLTEKIQLVEGRIDEAHRISKKFENGKAILPYFWYKYQDTKNFLNQEDLKYMVFVLKALNINGFIIWGSSNDVNTKLKCEELYNYVEQKLGPVLLNNFVK